MGDEDLDKGNQNTDDTTEPVAWKQHIPEDLKDRGYWEKYPNDIGGMLKLHAETIKSHDQRIPLPQTPDDPKWADVHKALGRPDAHTDYKYDLPEIKGVEWQKESVTGFQEASHNLGLNQKQYEGVMKFYTDSIGSQVTSSLNNSAQQAAATKIKLETEWGGNFGFNVELAKKAANHLFGDGGMDFVDKAYGNNEGVIKGLAKLGSELNEDGLFGGDVNARLGGVSVEDAQVEMKAIMNDKTNPLYEHYWGQSANQEHNAAVSRVNELAQIVGSGIGA